MIKLKNGTVLIRRNIESISPLLEFEGRPANEFVPEFIGYKVGVVIKMISGKEYPIFILKSYDNREDIDLESLENDSESFVRDISNAIFSNTRLKNIDIKNKFA